MQEEIKIEEKLDTEHKNPLPKGRGFFQLNDSQAN